MQPSSATCSYKCRSSCLTVAGASSSSSSARPGGWRAGVLVPQPRSTQWAAWLACSSRAASGFSRPEMWPQLLQAASWHFRALRPQPRSFGTPQPCGCTLSTARSETTCPGSRASARACASASAAASRCVAMQPRYLRATLKARAGKGTRGAKVRSR